MKQIAIFDLDHTLVSTDCTDEWIKVMCQLGLVSNVQDYTEQKNNYNQAYRKGKCDMMEIQQFVLQPMLSKKISTIQDDFSHFAQHIKKHFLYPNAKNRIQLHQDQKDTMLLISASIEDIVKPIGLELGFKIENIIGNDTVKENGYFTGDIRLPLSFSEGKCKKYQNWLRNQDITFEKSIFYSDSINDAPLLSCVDEAICINPDPILRKLALQNSWSIENWDMTTDKK
jgi:HAD superfamily hydrolase (TIGR01490 family)